MVIQPNQMFIGRQSELAILKTALGDASAGRVQMVMLAGEPGIGKTRLVEELATHAQTQSIQVLWGSCYEAGGALHSVTTRSGR